MRETAARATARAAPCCIETRAASSDVDEDRGLERPIAALLVETCSGEPPQLMDVRHHDRSSAAPH